MKQKSAHPQKFFGVGALSLLFFRFDSRIRCNTIASLPVVHSEILPARVAREARRLAAYYHQQCLQRTQLRFESIQDPADTLPGLVQAAQLFYFII